MLSVSFPLRGARRSAYGVAAPLDALDDTMDGFGGTRGGCVGRILVAWRDRLGYWSLIVTALVANIVTLSLIWTACPWRPKRGHGLARFPGTLHFGAYLAGFSVAFSIASWTTLSSAGALELWNWDITPGAIS